MTDLAPLVSALAGRRVVVIGDVMLDHFVIGQVERISPEAPVPVVRFAREEYRLGGAANVAHNLTALGARVSLVGLAGEDAAAAQLRRHLGAAGIDDHGLVIDRDRPTTRKMRVVTVRNQQVARIDHEHDGETDGAVLEALIERLRHAIQAADAIVLSDYRKGVVSPAVIAAAASCAAARHLPLLVDPKVARAERYRGVTLVTPNHHEAEVMTQQPIRSEDDARLAARRLHELTGASVLITRGEHGMWVLDCRRHPWDERALPAVAREVADVTGAGDTVIAVLALALAAGAHLADAARLANVAAGLVVARFGPATVSPAELRDAISALP
jgi:D-beta-D-heptose 7-phosphate kinase/D-beta-D-heptose 1-phosphate adenosyltransferase